MESYVIIVKDAEGKIAGVVGKRNGNAFNTEERADAVLAAMTLEEGEVGKVVAISPHEADL